MPWYQDKLVVLSIETSGLDYRNDRVLKIDLTTFGAGIEAKQYSWLLKQDIEISAEASAIHKLTTADLRSGEDPQQVLLALQEAINKETDSLTPLVVFSAQFVLTFLAAEANRLHLQPLELPATVIDPLIIDRQAQPYRKESRSLANLSHFYRIPTADSKNETLARLVWKMGRHYQMDQLSANDLYLQQIKWSKQQANSLQAYLRESKADQTISINGEWPIFNSILKEVT